MPDERTEPEVSHPSIKEETMAPSTTSPAASSTDTNCAGVSQSAIWSNEKLKRDKYQNQWRNDFSWLVTDDDLTTGCQMYLRLHCSSANFSLQASLPTS